ncbi:MAG: threonylcarbamoyl-AMP synthase [Proteobacteria bacterium]|jgi:tRNA threonylcarbamoyl adenosine modification protein (Sua5/YciO/YrdC/YwlC family)|nr:threonylcarbamoyl-AMP synthase [Pseudomonadota bacterium]
MLHLTIDAEWPNARQLGRAAEIIKTGGLVVYPTDTIYGLGCDITQKKSVERVYQMKGKERKTPLSFICPDLKNIAKYAIVSNMAYRLMKRILPGPYTIILPATREVPRLMQSKTATVGIRIPDHPVTQMLMSLLDNPIVTTSVPSPEQTQFDDPEMIAKRLPFLDAIIDCGLIAPEPSTVIDLTTDQPRLLRLGKGSIDQIPDIEVIDE